MCWVVEYFHMGVWMHDSACENEREAYMLAEYLHEKGLITRVREV